MFIGRYYYTIESKGRVSLPKHFRAEHPNWVITRGLDGGLLLFTQETFEERLAELANRTFTVKRDRDFLRLMANDAVTVTVDNNGRVLVPEYLKELAKISKDVVIVGSFHYLEMWEPTQYHDYLDKLAGQAAEVAEGINATTP
jgi:MraZ protein